MKKHGVKTSKHIFCFSAKVKKDFHVTCQKQRIVTSVIEYTLGLEKRSTFTKCLHKKVLINKCAMTFQALESFSILATMMGNTQICTQYIYVHTHTHARMHTHTHTLTDTHTPTTGLQPWMWGCVRLDLVSVHTPHYQSSLHTQKQYCVHNVNG